MKRILYLGGFELPDKNAAAQRVLSNAKLLREMGYEVVFIGTTKDIESAPPEICGFRSAPVPYPNNLGRWIFQIVSFVDTKTVLSINPDFVILYNFPSVASLRIIHLGRRHGFRVIGDLTEWEEPKGLALRSIIRRVDVKMRMRHCVKRMDGVITISRLLFDECSTKTNTILVPPLVDLKDPKWSTTVLEQREDGVTSLVYAGNAGFGIKDRLDYIIEALNGVKNVRLTVIGMTECEYESGYHKKVPSTIDISFKGRIAHLEAVAAVKIADFQMLIRDRNRKNDAGFPTKLVESMACGTPVIATLTSNIGDYLVDEYNCFIVSDKKSLREVLGIVSDLPRATINEMKRRCRNSKVFDYHQYKGEFAKLFNYY